MTSHLYSKPTRSRTQKLVLVLLVVIVVLIAALLFVWLKPASSTTPGAAAPSSSTQVTPTSTPSSAPASSEGTATAPAMGPAQWGIPVPGDGGPAAKSAAGVPRAYDASDAGVQKAAINAVVAARWMKFRFDDPAAALAELAVADVPDHAEVLSELTPARPLNTDTGEQTVEQSPAGGKVLGAHVVKRDAGNAVVKVLWEQFAQPSKGVISVSLAPIEVRLVRVQDDWLVSGLGRTPIDDFNPTSAVIGPVGTVKDWVPVPAESWYW